MDSIYNILGLIAFWSIIGFAIGYIAALVYDKYIRQVIASDFVAYYTGRAIPTDQLREFYNGLHKWPHVKKWILKFRLRNIKRTQKP